ncbi:d3902fe5-d5d9-41d6-9c16-b7e5ea629b5b-CDS [Sclerotinia trifoliorum]|uniref:D3902fe5-d5d9-41d6-9c16-b7e5ea629b5b-CDS n=1 Tax=Sclerotinia trifoliorum TaxID=28548 RepID=A0A8H2W6Z9_9HELO|nr:d3902fe5-d5d9-41d6-9c16-b7e5ea629b5b-CDS [Sclerotinia trifoliorum]
MDPPGLADGPCIGCSTITDRLVASDRVFHNLHNERMRNKDHKLRESEKKVRDLEAQVETMKQEAILMKPFLKIGMQLRTHKVSTEKSKMGSTTNIKFAGSGEELLNVGNAMADALLYQDIAGEYKRTDVEVYKRMYAGFHPDFILASKDCTRFLNILSWRRTMAFFYEQPYYEKEKFQYTFFARQSLKMKVKQRRWSGEEFETYFRTDEEGEIAYQDMKDEYEAELEKYRDFIRRDHKKNLCGFVAKLWSK